MKLNLGCGTAKIHGYINVDIDATLEPDQTFDFTTTFPYDNETVEEVVLYHVIEHIGKDKHSKVIDEIFRVLVPNGTLYVSFPEFTKCVDYWKSNYRGEREYWEATIYGRQSSAFDYHVCIVDSNQLSHFLVNSGFEILSVKSEPGQDHNTVIKCKKAQLWTYEDAIKEVVGF